jgi:hypothetical protein
VPETEEDRERRRAVAAHEAAHAVISLAAGCAVSLVTIDPEVIESLAAGVTCPPWRTFRSHLDPEVIKLHAAGVEGICIVDAGPLRGRLQGVLAARLQDARQGLLPPLAVYAIDHAVAIKIAREIAEEELGSAGSYQALEVRRSRLLREVKQTALQTLEQAHIQAAIEAVTIALLHQGTVTAADLAAICPPEKGN